jgi:phosphate transport system substrate-binding protein
VLAMQRGAKPMSFMKSAFSVSTFLAALFLGGALQPAMAQSDQAVTLRSFDGFTQLRGKLIDFDGSSYTIETVLGVIQVDALQVACEGEACPKDIMFDAKFGIYGSNTIGADLMPALIEGYADSMKATMVTEVGQSTLERKLRIIHENGREMAEVDLRTEGSFLAYAGLGAGSAAIGMSSRRARDTDLQELLAGNVPDLRDTEDEHVIAVDGLIAIVNPSNPIQAISIEELALVFSGALSNWSQLGGPDAPINVYALSDRSGTFETFEELVLSPFDLSLVESAERFTSNVNLSDSVASDPFAIGVTAIAFERASRALPIRQSCGILSYPTSFAMKTEEYPLSRRLYLYTLPGAKVAHAKQIVDFATSDAAQALIADAGFVNQQIERASINNQGARLIHALIGEPEVPFALFRQMLNDLQDAERLSMTLRFTTGTSSLEPKSQADAARLAQDLASGVYAGKEVLLVGFTDSVGQFQLNQALAGRRALAVEETVRSAVAPGALDGVALSSVGYGELAPVGCNTEPTGRSANRRVEVWIRDPR